MTESDREEALRSREIALKKMDDKDFIGAQKIILKAQKLFSGLDNISQLLTICKVHCAAEARVNGMMDWYAILQVEAGADEVIIKKQYRKLAISLHPDKNSFAGAEAAFKLVAEAHSLLCDPEKRSQYDIKRRKGTRMVENPRQKPSNRNDANKGSVPGSKTTFWTVCSQCQTRYQYYSRMMNSMVRCLRCNVNFCAFHLKENSVPTSSNVPNGFQIPKNMFPNQQSYTYSKQGHPVRPSPVDRGRGTHMKPNGHQFPANMFPNQQYDTRSQHGDPVDLSSAGGGTDMKLRRNVAQHDELIKEYSIPGRDGKANQSEMSMREFQFSKFNQEKSSDPTSNPAGPNIIDRQKSVREDPSAMPNVLEAPASAGPNIVDRHKSVREDPSDMPDIMEASASPAGRNIIDRQESVRQDPSAVPDVMKAPASAKPSSAGGKADEEPRINVATANEYTKGNSNTGQENEAIYLDKNACGRSIPEPDDISVVDGNNFRTKVASTKPSAAGSCYLRRSGRRKQDSDGGLSSDNNKRQRTNDLPVDVDDIATSDVRQSDSPHVSCKIDIQEKGRTADRNNLDDINTEAVNAIHEKKKTTGYSELLSFPDPDFFDFEELRDARLFSVGQIWALYDNLDGMPRYYAQIKRFDPPNLVHLTWLIYDAMDEEEMKWNDEELPVACGNFRLGKSRDTTSQDRSTFSHIVACTKGKRKNSYVIYPTKGEVWALYKGWSAKWSADPDNHRSYEYDVVEVLSSMSVKDGALVKPLVRIEGFVSLFAPAKDSSSYIIPSSELLRFSHSVPLYRTKGNEKEGVPGGFLELDNACLPADLDAAFPSVTLDSYMLVGNISSTFVDLTTDTTINEMELGEEQITQKENQSEAHACHPMSTDNHKDVSSEQGQGTPSQKNDDQFEEPGLLDSISLNTLTYPDPQFHDFDADRSIEKIECGQIWALYCDFDMFPKFYGWIRKVEREPFIVHLTWLEACLELEQEKRWLKQDIAVSCGTFKVRHFKARYSINESFSHLVDAKQTGTKWQFEVLPQVGQIWAIYMNWSPDWTPSRTDVGDFVISEIVERTEASIKLTFLTQVDGYRSVFKPDRQKGVMEIPTRERLRFSHQIPSFRLTGQRGGRLRGFYELDPASVPDAFLYRDT